MCCLIEQRSLNKIKMGQVVKDEADFSRQSCVLVNLPSLHFKFYSKRIDYTGLTKKSICTGTNITGKNTRMSLACSAV
jgi:hypothetical protein